VGVRTVAIILDFSKNFNSNPQKSLLTKIAATGVELKVVEWVKGFVLGLSDWFGAERKMSEELRVT